MAHHNTTWFAIVSIALSVTVFELLDVDEYRDNSCLQSVHSLQCTDF